MMITHPIVAAALLLAMGACGAGSDEVDAESAAILARVPLGTPLRDLPAAMQALGFSCATGRRPEPHFVCEREQSRWLVCTRRTRAILLQLNGRLSNVLVNVGRFCA